jgi:hypothetical protein
MEEKVNRLGSALVYAVVFFGGGIVAWLMYQMVSESHVELMAGAEAGYARPLIVVTSPTNEIVSQPMIQIIGYYPTEIKAITFDVFNADGLNRSQVNGINQGYVTSRFFDKKKQQANLDRVRQTGSNRIEQSRQSLTNKSAKPVQPDFMSGLYESVFTTNFFQIYDVNLAKGKNKVIIHIREESGREHSFKRFYTLDLASDKTPPEIKIEWPKDGTPIGGDAFTLQAIVDDNNAKIKVWVKNSKGTAQMDNAIVERSGVVWVKNIPIARGTNRIMVVATDAAGNSSTNILNVTRASVTVTMLPLEKSQLNKPHVNVKGTVSDSGGSVYVNGVRAMKDRNGTWEADGAPVLTAGPTNIEVKVLKQ